jgi:tetratricopeptide (TPR) repeat protein
MNRRLLHPLRGILSFCAVLCAILVPCAAQERPKPGAPIDLDKELRVKVPQDRAKSYYYYSLAKWLEDGGDIDRALTEMRNALKFNESSVWVRLDLAELLDKTGNSRDAMAEAQEAARLDPKDPEPHWVLANLYFKYQGRDRANAKDSMKKAVRELESMRDDDPSDERSYFALGQAYLELGEPEKAIQAYEKYQSLVPNVDAGYSSIAEYYEKAGNHEKAIEYLNKAIKSQPDSSKSLMMLANLLLKLDRGKEAVPLLRRIMELSGDNPAVKKQLATSVLEAGDFGEAVRLLEELKKSSAVDSEVRILLGRALMGQREYSRAIEVLKEAVDEVPGDQEARFYLGTAYEQSGNPAEAAKVFSELLSENNTEGGQANRPVFQQHLAAAYQDLGEHAKAIEIYEKLLKEDSSPRLVFLLINAYRLNHQLDKAVAMGRQQFEKTPGETNIGLVYARALADSGNTKEGAEILKKLLQADPSNVDIYVNLSQVYLQGKEYSEAEKILERAEAKKLDSERVKFQLGTIYEKQKDFDKAESVFKEVLKDNPKNAIVLNYIGYMLADQGVRLQEAVKYVEEALAIDPNNGAYLDSLGWAFFKLNELEKAEKYLLQAIDLVKNDPVIHDHLGDLYFRTGDLEKAKDFWTKSISAGTEPEDIQKVREKLEKLDDSLRKGKHR